MSMLKHILVVCCATVTNIAVAQTFITHANPDTIMEQTPEMLAQQQLNAYNAHDLEAFLEPYADDVKVYNFPDELQLSGKEAMRERYSFLNNASGLHAEILNRTVFGNMVIDHERATRTGRPTIEVIAIYIIENNKISKVYFKR